MITHYSKAIELDYDKIRAIRLPLMLPETADNPRRQINKHEAITAEHLAELGLLPAEEPPILAEGQKYGIPQLVDGVVNVAAIDKTIEEVNSENFSKVRMARQVEYPDIGDQLDTIMKQFNQLRLSGQPMIQEMDDLIGECLAVKSRNPFPEIEYEI